MAAIDREVEGYSPRWSPRPWGAWPPGCRRSRTRRSPAATHRGVYDTSADSRAVLDAAPGVAGLFVAGGFSGTGFKKSPAVGAAAELVTEGQATTVHPFRLARFAEGDPIVGDEYRLRPSSSATCGSVALEALMRIYALALPSSLRHQTAPPGEDPSLCGP